MEQIAFEKKKKKKPNFLPQLKLVIGLSLKVFFRYACPDLPN